MALLVAYLAEACCWPNSLSATRSLLSRSHTSKRSAPMMDWMRRIPVAFKGGLLLGPAAYWILAPYAIGECLYGE